VSRQTELRIFAMAVRLQEGAQPELTLSTNFGDMGFWREIFHALELEIERQRIRAELAQAEADIGE